MNIAMVSVFVDDTEKAFRFYTEVLGFKEKLHLPEQFVSIVVAADDPQGTTLLLEPNQNPIATTYQKALWEAGLPPIVFGSKDIQAEYERLKGKGVVFRGEPKKSEWGTSVLFEDTCGNLIQLHQP